jgi:hypothetical protein
MTEKKKEYEQKRKQEMDNYKEELRSWILDKESSFYNLNSEIQDKIKKLVGRVGAGKKVYSVNDDIRAYILEHGQITLDEAFSNFRVGVDGMKAFVKSQLKKKDSANWLWVEASPDGEVYTLKGQGAEPPEGYQGWIPTEMRNI